MFELYYDKKRKKGTDIPMGGGHGSCLEVCGIHAKPAQYTVVQFSHDLLSS